MDDGRPFLPRQAQCGTVKQSRERGTGGGVDGLIYVRTHLRTRAIHALFFGGRLASRCFSPSIGSKTHVFGDDETISRN